MVAHSGDTPLILAFDIGTSSVKAALFTPQGERVAGATQALGMAIPKPGWVEQNPQDWWTAICAAAQALWQQAEPHRVVALAFTAQMCGCIPVDADGKPLHPCLTWLDTRSQQQAVHMTAGGPRVAGYGAWALAHWLWLTNGAPNLSGKDPTSKMAWFRDARPDIWARTHRFLDVKDWLIHRCTGRFVTSDDLGQLRWLLDNRPGRREWSPSLVRRAGLEPAHQPELVRADAPAGELTPGAAQALGLRPGIVVSCGVGDLNACALASGATSDGAWHMYVGTSAWVGTHLPRRRVDPFTGIATICSAFTDRYLLIATQDTAGQAAQWAAEALGWGAGEAGLQALDRDAGLATPGAHTPLFLPWLQGERVPVDDPNLRGGFAGITLGTSRCELAYAVLAGVALNVRWALAAAGRLAPRDGQPIRMLGGACNSPIWPQIFADMLGETVEVVQDARWAGARGAALLAAVAAGLTPDIARGASQIGIARRCEPDARVRGWADERYAALRSFHRATRGWHRAHAPGEGGAP